MQITQEFMLVIDSRQQPIPNTHVIIPGRYV